MNQEPKYYPQAESTPSTLKPMKAAERRAVVESVIDAIQGTNANAALVSLTDAARRSTFRPMSGLEAPALSLTQVVEKTPTIRAALPSVDPKEIGDVVALIFALDHAREELSRWLKWMDDSALVLRADLFQTVSMIHRVATANPAASADSQVKIFEEYLARGKRGPKPEDDPVVVEPVAPLSNGHDVT